MKDDSFKMGPQSRLNDNNGSRVTDKYSFNWTLHGNQMNGDNKVIQHYKMLSGAWVTQPFNETHTIQTYLLNNYIPLIDILSDMVRN